ncbi:MAG: HPr family phosphocarrier protein [Alphaproteobacteria bacterium]|nr:HPr family phosphocarrier protein [Alphaproteobacteria bacterium]
MTDQRSAVATVRNIRGLHARASAKFCSLAATFDAAVHVEFDGWRVRGDSIMGLMMIGAGPGAEIKITAEGADAEAALAALVALVEEKFGEKE